MNKAHWRSSFGLVLWLAAALGTGSCGASGSGGGANGSGSDGGSGSDASATCTSDAQCADGGPGAVLPPVFAPAAGTYTNDFKVALTSATPGATICFTLDGSTPSCANGACQGTASTYSSVSQISIDGSVTSTTPGPSLGMVTVHAVACKAGESDGTAPAAAYALQVAQPTLQGPAPGSLAYTRTKAMPTIASVTIGATAFYTTAQSDSPSCTNGTSVPSLPAPLAIDETLGNTTLHVIACKPGYLPSPVLDGAYTVALNPPQFTPGSGATEFSNIAVQVDDSANAGSGDYVCITTDGTTQPACGCTGAAKHPGGTTSAVVFSATSSTVDTTGATLRAIACSPAAAPFADSPLATSGPYTLQLDPIEFTPASGAPIPDGGTLVVTISQNGSDHPYDFICLSTDGTTMPDCACNTSFIKVMTLPVRMLLASPTTIKAVGCLAPAPTDLDVYLPSNTPAASATY